MKFKIPQDIINKTKCEYNFSCTNTGKCNDKDLCKVIENFGKDTLFADCKNNLSCQFSLRFGNTFICTCPVRAYIFHNYGV